MTVRDLLTAAEDYLEVKIMKNGGELFKENFTDSQTLLKELKDF